MARRRTTILMAALLVVAGCSDESDDGAGLDSGPGDSAGGAALVESFDAAAEAAYEASDADRSEDFNRGVLIDEGCFALDDAGAVAVAGALEVDGADDAEIDDGSAYLTGMPRQRETLVCNIAVGEDQRIGVQAGTTVLERDELLDQLEVVAEQRDEDVEVIDGEAPGLDGDTVLAVDQDGFGAFTWIDGDFMVTLSFPEELADYDRGFEALPVLVDRVASTLTGG